ncbi:MAG TPA: retropepsin-like aspartic protease, partial [Terracidiphilus sp.]
MSVGVVSRRAFRLWSFLRIALSIAVLASAIHVAAQQTAPVPQTDPNAPPGQGAQVHTGHASGIDPSARIRSLLADHEYLRVANELDQLPAEQAQLYRGVLANRNNETRLSIELLEPLVEKVTASGDKEQEKLLRVTLAEDYLRAGEMLKAAKAYEVLSGRFWGKLTPAEQDDIEMPLKLLPLAVDNPVMTVDPCEPFSMQVSRNRLGLIDVPVFVDAHPRRWMLDPTAPFNLIARSAAREVGLKISDQSATIRTLTGKPIEVHATLIPRITIGGRLTLRNMTAFVYEDKDYFGVQGVLGFPAVSALGSLTITGNATVLIDPRGTNPREVHPDKEPDADAKIADGARFFLDGDRLIVALGQTGSERMFAVDAGGQQSYMTSRYYNEHARSFGGKTELFKVPGSEQLPPQPAYTAETIPLLVGGTRVEVHFLQVITVPLGRAAIDDVYGVLGVDVLDQLGSYTFDYRT